MSRKELGYLFFCLLISYFVIFKFSDRFKLNATSRILFSTNLFFDPSMVELLTALHVGAELILVPDVATARSSFLEQQIIENRPTFVQVWDVT